MIRRSDFSTSSSVLEIVDVLVFARFILVLIISVRIISIHAIRQNLSADAPIACLSATQAGISGGPEL